MKRTIVTMVGDRNHSEVRNVRQEYAEDVGTIEEEMDSSTADCGLPLGARPMLRQLSPLTPVTVCKLHESEPALSILIDRLS